MKRLARMAHSARGTLDIGVADEEVSGIPNEERDEARTHPCDSSRALCYSVPPKAWYTQLAGELCP